MLHAAVRRFSTERLSAILAPISIRAVVDSVFCNLRCKWCVGGSDDFSWLNLLLFCGYLPPFGRLFISFPICTCNLNRVTQDSWCKPGTGAYGAIIVWVPPDDRPCRRKVAALLPRSLGRLRIIVATYSPPLRWNSHTTAPVCLFVTTALSSSKLHLNPWSHILLTDINGRVMPATWNMGL